MLQDSGSVLYELDECTCLLSALSGPTHKATDWPRDMAGVLLRLDAMARTAELPNVGPVHAQRLARLVEGIWAQFEKGGKSHLDPHYWRAFYSQALVAWLCAWRSGMASEVPLAEAVRRAGRALVKMDKARGHDKGLTRACDTV